MDSDAGEGKGTGAIEVQVTVRWDVSGRVGDGGGVGEVVAGVRYGRAYGCLNAIAPH